mgnify:CR=1 FL=1
MDKGVVYINDKALKVVSADFERNLYSNKKATWFWSVKLEDNSYFDFFYQDVFNDIPLPHLLAFRSFKYPNEDPLLSTHYDQVKIGKDQNIFLWQNLNMNIQDWNYNDQTLYVNGYDQNLMDEDSYHEAEEEDKVNFIDFKFEIYYQFNGFYLHKFGQKKVDELVNYLSFFIDKLKIEKQSEEIYLLRGIF